MMRSRSSNDRWRSLPLIIGFAVALLLLAGLAVIYQNERTYQVQKVQEAQVQAEILAASVTAALDFHDSTTAQEAVNALSVNPQVTGAGVYDLDRRLFVSFERVHKAVPPSPIRGQVDGSPVEVIVPVVQSGERIGTVYLGLMREPVSRRLTRYAVVALLVLMATLVVGVLGIAATALRRVNRELEARAAALSDAYRRLQIESDERAKAEEQLRQAQKMQALGQLTGGIAHDFNNLLTVIQGSADILRRPGLSEEKRIRFADAIAQTSSRAATLTGQLLAFARRQPLQPEVFDINERILAMSDLLDRTLGEMIEVRTQLASDLCAIQADPAQLEAALLNVAVNARDAMANGGTLTILTTAVTLEDGNPGVAVSVSDCGAGMDEETLNRVFEPFFTTKAVGKGTGLGLSQVYGFAAQSGGSVDISSCLGEGTTVTITLPCTDSPAAPPTEEEITDKTHRTGRILVVDDNEEVGAFAESLLSELGHEVVRARSGAEALELARRTKLDIVFSDVVMPGMSGLELVERLREVWPHLPVVLTTGYSDEISASGTGGLPIVFKPYRLETLADVLDRMLTNDQD